MAYGGVVRGETWKRATVRGAGTASRAGWRGYFSAACHRRGMNRPAREQSPHIDLARGGGESWTAERRETDGRGKTLGRPEQKESIACYQCEPTMTLRTMFPSSSRPRDRSSNARAVSLSSKR